MIFGLLAASQSGGQPWLNQNNPAIWSGNSNCGTHSNAGVVVNPDSALNLSAYFACINVISEDTSKLPLIVNENKGDGKSQPALERREVRLLNEQANENATSMTVREHLAAETAGRGNGFAELQWGGNGTLHAIHALQSARMEMKLVRHSVSSMEVIYIYENDWGEKVRIPAEDLLHVVGESYDGIVGVSVVCHAAESIGTGLAQQNYTGTFYGNSAQPSAVLQHPSKLSQEAQDRLRQNWENIHRGSAKAHKVAVLEEGLTYEPISINPKDAELLATKRFTIEEIARWFRMPPQKIQHHVNAKGWSTVEQENQIYLSDTLMPWLERIEQEMNRKLFPDGDFFVRHSTASLLRADTQGRGDWYAKMISTGVLSINEARALENLEGIGADGDERFVPANLIQLDKAVADEPPPTETPPPPSGNEDDDEGEEEDTDDEAAARFSAIKPFVEHAAARVMRKEHKAMTRILTKPGSNEEKRTAEAGKFFNSQVDEMHAEFSPAFGGWGMAGLAALCQVFCTEGLKVYITNDAEKIAEHQKSAPEYWAREVLALAESVGKHEAIT